MSAFNLNDLTVGQAKELTAMLGGVTTQKQHPFVGKYVITRCYATGIHTGEVVNGDDENVLLKNSHRLWNWKAKDGVALSDVAQEGITGDCKIDLINPEIYITGVYELIPYSSSSEESIRGYK